MKIITIIALSLAVIGQAAGGGSGAFPPYVPPAEITK